MLIRRITRYVSAGSFRQDASTLTRRVRRTARIVRAAGAGPTGKRLPRQTPPVRIEESYAAAIRTLVVDRLRAALGPLLDELPDLIASANRDRDAALRTDTGEGRRIRELMAQAREELGDAVTPKALEKLARDFARRTAAYNKIQLERQTRAAMGVDVFAQDRALKPLTEAFVDANVGLIKDIGDALANEIEMTTMRAIQEGKLHGDLAEELEARFGFAEDRAALIARDQVGKAYGQINAARQRELGVSRFVWRTVNDERVRSEHEERNGETYSYDDPPEGELPGEPINCRCYAEPVFDDILDELEE